MSPLRMNRVTRWRSAGSSRRIVTLLSAATIFGSWGAVPMPLVAQRHQVAVEELRSIGVAAGNPNEEFGYLYGLAVDERRGLLFLFDAYNLRLSVFSHDGRFIAAAGRSGQGPGEFRTRSQVALIDSVAIVADPGNLRLSSWELRSDSLVLVGETRMQTGLGGRMCSIRDRLFFLQFHPDGIVQRATTDGALETSFGRPFVEDNATLAATTVSGRIACDPRSGSIFIAAGAFAIVRRYSARTGALEWEAEIPTMVPPVVTRNPRLASGLPVYSAPRGRTSADQVVSLLVVHGGRVVVQIGEAFRPAPDVLRVRSVVFDAQDGTFLGTLEDLPHLDLATDAYAYSSTNDPFPRVRVYQWKRTPE